MNLAAGWLLPCIDCLGQQLQLDRFPFRTDTLMTCYGFDQAFTRVGQKSPTKPCESCEVLFDRAGITRSLIIAVLIVDHSVAYRLHIGGQ